MLDGRFYTDAEITERLKEAVTRVGENQVRRFGQPPEEALAALGFDTTQIGAESYLKPVPKKRERRQKRVKPRRSPSVTGVTRWRVLPSTSCHS